jgi:hypothetical protein
MAKIVVRLDLTQSFAVFRIKEIDTGVAAANRDSFAVRMPVELIDVVRNILARVLDW